MLRLHTLSRLELLEGDPPATRIVAVQPKRLGLLAYLAVARPRGFHARDTLLALFWPELSDSEARRALRQAIHYLKGALGEGAILTRPDDRIALADGPLWCDAVVMEQAADAGDLDRAMALYQGDFLAGVQVMKIKSVIAGE